jgi:hypothetical protein
VAGGFQALLKNTTGNSNVAIGAGAGANLTTGSNNIDIAHPGVAGESATIRIGSTNQTRAFLRGVYGNSLSGQTVVVNSNGRLGTAPVAAKRQTVDRLRDKVGELSAAVQRLREEVRRGG